MSSLMRPASPPQSRRLTRRDALQLMTAHMAAALGGCSKPNEEIVPYVEMPERIVPGEPLHFATALPFAGYARGVIVTSIDGRPIKIEGNPRHPDSLGATDLFAQAAVLSLYDPDRSQTVLHEGAIASWDMFLKALLDERQRLQADQGRGFRLLTSRVTSPTLARQIDALLKVLPQARWHVHEPADDAAERGGADLAFARPVQTLPRLDLADAILALDADPLGPGPSQVRNAAAWISRRLPSGGPGAFSRFYAIESAPTLSGVKADSRVAAPAQEIHNAAIGLANMLGAGLPEVELSSEITALLHTAAADFAPPRRGLVLAGRTMAPEVHALVHWINNRLGAPVELINPADRVFDRSPGSLSELSRDLQAGQVDVLAIFNANPAYDAPADLNAAELIKKARLRIHFGLYVDETAALCTWHVPSSHSLESWSDLRAVDGTASVVQPLIVPLYATRTAHEVVAAFSGLGGVSSYDVVRQTWSAKNWSANNWSAKGAADFEQWWREALHHGLLPESAEKTLTLGAPSLPKIEPRTRSREISLVLAPDPCLWDGSMSNNAWLQECPKPITKEVWGNALALGPADARRLGVTTNDVVEVEAAGNRVASPLIVVPGMAAGVARLTLGYGRTKAGAIGNDVGANAYALRTTTSPWLIDEVKLAKTGRRREVLITQNYVRLDGKTDDLFPVLTVAELAQGESLPARAGPLPSLLPRSAPEGVAWAMVVDTHACIGCNACVLACQAENNVPVVGPDEIARGRDMHWLRVDIYDRGTAQAPQPGFQPVPCMHCEKAPCEPVCPVAASVHDHEGLNVQVYNRCVGTRFCEANCPYKVRRFNFFGYADGQEYAHLGAEPLKAQKNPEVTVRARGVMEKCTYCVQRISRARRAAEREQRPLGENDVVTACQAACPTRAIAFGDLNRTDSSVHTLRTSPRHYALLGHLDTRPRTTYLAEVKNPAPAHGSAHEGEAR
jgi:molybdopterin-containing oxidoreductase family iron-sulfur binding subunit